MRLEQTSRFVIAAVLALASQSAFAEDAKVPEASSNEDIVVTAQRRDESLSKTPVAVTVVSADLLAKAQIITEQDLRTVAPGLAVRAGLSSNQLNYSLRGQSQDAFSGTRPGVLPYINDVQISGAGGATAFYDLQSVQVLKGPQGTLFGRSATGGAVLFTTAKPTETFSGYASVLGGNYSAFKAEGAVSGPIAGDRLQARVAGFYTRRHGYQENVVYGGREGDYERYGARGSLTAKLGESVKNDLVVDYFRSDSGSTVGVTSGLLPLGAPGTPPFIPAELIYSGNDTPVKRATGIAVLQGALSAQLGAAGTPQPIIDAILSGVPGAYDAYFAQPGHLPIGLRSFFELQQNRGPYKVASDALNAFRAKNTIITNTTEFELGDNLQLKNIFGFSNIDTYISYEIEGSPYGIGSDGTKARPGDDHCTCIVNRSFSDELQLIGKGLDGRLSYVGGVYFSDERSTNHFYSEFLDLLFAPLGLPAQIVRNDFIITNKTIAGYGQATMNLNDSGLSVTAGLRYTSEKVGKVTLPTDSGRIAAGDPAPTGFDYDKSQTFNRLSWQFGIQNQVNAGTLLYAVTRRAYKSGGYNGSVTRGGFALTGGDTYLSERVTDIEAGAKYKGEIGQVPARLNIAFYHNWIRNSQRTAYTLVAGAPAALTVNVPSVRIYGLEFDGQIAPAKWLSLGGSLNLTEAKFTNGNVIVNGNSQQFDRTPDTPKYSASVYADITVPLSGSIQGSLHGDVYAQGRSFTGPRSANNAGTTLPNYAIANFRVGVSDPDAGWVLTANLKNAFNRVYYVGGVAAGEIYQVNSLVPAEPRTVTVELRYKF